MRTEPVTARKARTRIAACLAQNEMPFRINRPKKTAVRDRPNTFVVARSLVFVMTWVPALRFFLLRQGKVRKPLGERASIQRLPPSIGSWHRTIRRCNTEVRE